MSQGFHTTSQASAAVITLGTIENGGRYRIPSGLGGSFDVRVQSIKDGVANVLIDEPRNPDWNGHQMSVAITALAPIPRKFQVRTRVGKLNGKPDDYLCWATVATREIADEEARQAAYYPACHPIKVVEIEV